jgi:hypothetical protein
VREIRGLRGRVKGVLGGWRELKSMAERVELVNKPIVPHDFMDVLSGENSLLFLLYSSNNLCGPRISYIAPDL